MGGNKVQIPVGKDDCMGGYLALPPNGRPGPGLVILQEIFGVNEAIRAVTDAFAAEGFVALAPDLFWRFKPDIDLGYDEVQRKQAFEYFRAFDASKGAADSAAALTYLKSLSACTGKAAYVGFCLGGKLAIMAAALGGAQAAVSFYGVQLEKHDADLTSGACPLQLHVGDRDDHVPAPAIEQIRAILAKVTDADLFVYPGARHAFFNEFRGEAYSAPAAALARQRTLDFLNAALR